MQNDNVVKLLKEKGYRITKQRQIIIDIILNEDCTCSKEIYYKAVEKDSNIGASTVYRMINTLEELGAINRKNMYKLDCNGKCEKFASVIIHLNDKKTITLSTREYNKILEDGLKLNNYIESQKVIKTSTIPCFCHKID